MAQSGVAQVLLAGRSLTAKKKSVPVHSFPKKARGHNVLAVGGWRLAVGGWWRLVVVGGGWWSGIGG